MNAANGYRPAIVVAGYARPASLRRLLGALNRSAVPEGTPLVISLDHCGIDEVREVAGLFSWHHGEKVLRLSPERMGLKRHILSCGDLTEQYGSILLLEDDLYISPWFYQFAAGALDYYGADGRIAGVSLYSYGTNVHANLPFQPLDDGNDVYFMQMPCSWGVAWSHTQWHAFRQWLADNDGTLGEQDDVPEFVLAWPDTSWLKHFVKYMAVMRKYFVFPRSSLSTNCGDTGTNHTSTHQFQVPLLSGRKNHAFVPLESADAVYDSYFEMLPSRLSRLNPALAGYEYAVDLYGIKRLAMVRDEYLLTTRPCGRSVMSFGRALKPIEMNVINSFEGAEIFLCRRDDVGSSGSVGVDAFEYFHGALPLRRLLAHIISRLWRKAAGWFRCGG